MIGQCPALYLHLSSDMKTLYSLGDCMYRLNRNRMPRAGIQQIRVSLVLLHVAVCLYIQYTRIQVCVFGYPDTSPDWSNGLVEQGGDVLLLVAVRRAENHHAVLMEKYTQC